MSVDQGTIGLICQQGFPAGGRLGRGEAALKTALEDESIPNQTAWLVRPADEEAGREHVEVYLLAEGALYRLRAPADAADASDPSECACDFIRIRQEARFSLAVVNRLVENPSEGVGEKYVREIVRTWSFNLGAGESLEVRTSSLNGQVDQPEQFARAFASAITQAN